MTEEFAPELKKDLENAGLEVVFYERFDVELKDFAPTFARSSFLVLLQAVEGQGNEGVGDRKNIYRGNSGGAFVQTQNVGG